MLEENQQQLPQSERELELALEQAKKERIEVEERLSQQRIAAEAAQQQRQAMNFDLNLRQAIAKTGLKTYDIVEWSDFKKFVEASFKFDIKADGSFDVVDQKTGRVLDFDEEFKKFAVEKAFFMFDQRSLKVLQTPVEELCKTIMTDSQKAAFISKHGLVAWEKLPLYPQPKINTSSLTAAQYRSLPAAEKAKLVQKLGVSGIAEILSRR